MSYSKKRTLYREKKSKASNTFALKHPLFCVESALKRERHKKGDEETEFRERKNQVLSKIGIESN